MDHFNRKFNRISSSLWILTCCWWTISCCWMGNELKWIFFYKTFCHSKYPKKKKYALRTIYEKVKAQKIPSRNGWLILLKINRAATPLENKILLIKMYRISFRESSELREVSLSVLMHSTGVNGAWRASEFTVVCKTVFRVFRAAHLCKHEEIVSSI